MGTDIIRPYATISLCDLVIVARLLDMKWTTFEPAQGILRAEGYDSLISSRVVQSVGTVIDFRVIRLTEEKKPKAPLERWYIPEAQVYRMMFGIIPGDHKLTTFADSGFRVCGKGDWHKTLENISDATGSSGDVDDIDYLAADFLPLVA